MFLHDMSSAASTTRPRTPEGNTIAHSSPQGEPQPVQNATGHKETDLEAIFEDMEICNDHMQEVTVAVRAAGASGTAGDAFRIELESRMHPDALVPCEAQAQPALYHQP